MYLIVKGLNWNKVNNLGASRVIYSSSFLQLRVYVLVGSVALMFIESEPLIYETLV